MASGSTVPAVKAALLTLLDAALSVQTADGHPGEDHLAEEAVYIGGLTAGRHSIPVFKGGRKTREERYSVEVWVWATKPKTETVTATEARAFVLLQEVEDILADDPTLGAVDGVIHAVAGGFEAVADMTATGPACVIRFEVDVVARLA